MQWDDHRQWARKFGISDPVADYVNRIIDFEDPGRLPDDYLQDIGAAGVEIAKSRGATQGNSALGLVIAADARDHDAGRRKTTRGNLAAECTVRHLQSKGDEFVDAWYLHHHLDYLHEQRDTAVSLIETISHYRDAYPEAHSQEVEAFLRHHRETLAADLGYAEE